MGMQSNQPNLSNVQPSGKVGMTSSLVSDQPGMGQPNNNATPNAWQGSMGQQNQYPNTVGNWDNASIMPNQQSGGKGGKSGQQPFDVYTPPPGGYQSPSTQQTNPQDQTLNMGSNYNARERGLTNGM